MDLAWSPKAIVLLTEDASCIPPLSNEKPTHCKTSGNILNLPISIEKRFDIPFIAALAMREKQIQQNYRPIIAVHKWFARRPGTLFLGLILSEYGDWPLRKAESYFQDN